MSAHPPELLTPKQVAERAGVDWARQQIAAVVAEHRIVRGGWPGTIREARARVESSLRREHPALVSFKEIEEAVHVAYAAARRTWLSNQQPEEDDHELGD